MNKIPIVFTFDDNLVLPACVCISSLLQSANLSTFYEIIILHPASCDYTETKLVEYPDIYGNCSITFKAVEREFESAYEVRGITNTAYYRLLIPEILLEYDKVLYSDVDVIFREDMLQYYNTDLDGFYMAGVDNASALRPGVQKYIKEQLGIDHKYGHFYSGNLVMNLSLLRQDNMLPRFRELALHNYNQQDMDIINIACYGKIKSLPPAFCLTNYLTEMIVYRKDEMLGYFSEDILSHALSQGIVHYNGPKPWKEFCVNFDIWWEYYRKSPVYDNKFYFNFFYNKQGELDKLPFVKRLKILMRFFIYGNK